MKQKQEAQDHLSMTGEEVAVLKKNHRQEKEEWRQRVKDLKARNQQKEANRRNANSSW